MRPLRDLPLLIFNKTLIAADLHLGIEYEFLSKGINLYSMNLRLKEEIEKVIEEEDVSRIIFLGDLKHNVPRPVGFEARELSEFLDFGVDVVVVKGNHDGGIELFCDDVVSELVIEDVLLTHGHRKIELLKYKHIVVGHSHPAIEFRDELSKITREKCWFKCKLKNSNTKITVMPAFNPLILGTPLNRTERIPGYLFRKDRLDLEKGEVHLLDGTFLSSLKGLRIS